MAGLSSKLLKQLPSEEEMQRILGSLSANSDTAAALLGAAYIERALELLLTAYSVKLDKDDRNAVFEAGGRAPLSGLSAKIRIAHAFGFIGPLWKADLLLVTTIRNVFAHTLHKSDFTNELIAADAHKLFTYKNMATLYGRRPDTLSPRDKYFGTAGMFCAGVKFKTGRMEEFKPQFDQDVKLP